MLKGIKTGWAPFLIFFVLVLGWVNPVFGQQDGKIVKSIGIKGNQRVDSETILYYIKTEVGKPLSRLLVRKDIKEIYRLGQFSDIHVETEDLDEGVSVTYWVVEIPSIGDITFVGNDLYEAKDLLEEISLRRGATFNDHLITDTVEKIKAKYHEKAYFLVQIAVDKINTNDGLVNITIKINEGEKIKIEEIRFIGNKYIRADDLQDQMETKEENLLTFFNDSGVYKKDILKLDVLRLEAYYQDRGFLRIRVHDPSIEINRASKEIYITIRVEEGDQYRVGKIEVEGDKTYSKKEILKTLETKPKAIYNVSQLRQDILNVTELYSQKGYAYADINPTSKIDDKKRLVNLKIVIDPGSKVYVGKINVLGNLKTRDNVIRREFRIKEGELFNSKKLKRSKQRINNLGYFADVKIDTRRGKEPDLIDIDTTLTERPTGSISFGIGFSSVENLIFNASIAQDNLFGRGQRLNLSTNLSSRRTNFDLNFTEPRIFDSEVSFGVDAFNSRSNFFSFDSESRGGGVRFGKNLSETDWIGISYRFSRVEISDVLPQNATPLLMDGTRTTSRIGPTFIRDTRDNFINPTQGWRHVIRFEIAGNILGGSDFFKAGYEVSYYRPIAKFFNRKLVGVVHAAINYGQGYGGEVMPVFEHYFLGGANSLRGFTIRQVGPKTSTGDPIGGDHSLLINLELQYPLNKQFLFYTFYDRGNVFGSGADLSSTEEVIDFFNMRESVGIGMRFFSPFGPISVAYGFKLDKQTGESSGEFHFSAGKAF